MKPHLKNSLLLWSWLLFLPDQPQRVFSNVDQTPQSLHGLVRRRCHVWELQEGDPELNLLSTCSHDGT